MERRGPPKAVGSPARRPGPDPRPAGCEHGRYPRRIERFTLPGYKGKEADRLVTRIGPSVVSRVAELRGHERQAVEELEQWKARVGERKLLDASPAAITLGLLLSDQELDPGEEGPLEMEKSRGADGAPG